MKDKKFRGKRLPADSVQAMGMLAPMMLGFIVFTYVPIIYILRYSLYDSNGFKESWVGLDNFVRLFTRDSAYWKSLGTTFILAFGKLALEIPLAMLLALFLNKGIRGTGFFRVALFLPAIISTAICGLIFSLMFASYNGIINTMLQNIGWIQKPISWFSNRWTALLVLGLASVWNNFGINMIFFLMALQSVPKELYESAEIDGITPGEEIFQDYAAHDRPHLYLRSADGNCGQPEDGRPDPGVHQWSARRWHGSGHDLCIQVFLRLQRPQG